MVPGMKDLLEGCAHALRAHRAWVSTTFFRSRKFRFRFNLDLFIELVHLRN